MKLRQFGKMTRSMRGVSRFCASSSFKIDKISDANLENKTINSKQNTRLASILESSLKYSYKKSWEIDPEILKKKKYPTRQRIEMLLDKDSFFVELSQLAGHEIYDQGKY